MKTANSAHHCRVQTPRQLPATIDEFNDEMAATIRRAVANDRGAAKRLARIVDKSARTTEKWMTGEHAPHVFHVIKLALEIPALKSLLRAYLDLERNLDPQTEAKLIELQRALAETLERGR